MSVHTKDRTFVLDTKKICFMCLRSPEDDKGQGYKLKKFPYRTLNRFLSLECDNVFDVTVGVETRRSNNGLPFLRKPDEMGDISVKLCVDCFSLATQFSTLFQDQEMIRLKIHHCIQRIHDVMTLAGRVRNRVKHYKRAMKKSQDPMDIFFVEAMEKLRKETMKKCVSKMQTSIPKVRLEKVDEIRNAKKPGNVASAVKPKLVQEAKKSRSASKEKEPSVNLNLSSVAARFLQAEPSVPDPPKKTVGRKKKKKKGLVRKMPVRVRPYFYHPNAFSPTSGSGVRGTEKDAANDGESEAANKGSPDNKPTFRRGRKRKWGGDRRAALIKRRLLATEMTSGTKKIEKNKSNLGRNKINNMKYGGVMRPPSIFRNDEELDEELCAKVARPTTRKSVKEPDVKDRNSTAEIKSRQSKETTKTRAASLSESFEKGKEKMVESQRITNSSKSKNQNDSIQRKRGRPKKLAMMKSQRNSEDDEVLSRSTKRKVINDQFSNPIRELRSKTKNLKDTRDQSSINMKSLSVSLPRLARTVISKYKRENRTRAQEEISKEKEKSACNGENATTTAPARKPGVSDVLIFSCHFCSMKFSSAKEVRKHASKFHYCQLFFSSLKQPDTTDEEFKNAFDTFFAAEMKNKSRGRANGCPYCAKAYVQMRFLRGHIAEAHFKTLKENFAKMTTLKKPAKNKTGITKSPPRNLDGTNTKPTTTTTYEFQCCYCDRGFHQDRDHRLHTGRHHADQIFASFKLDVSDEIFKEAIEKAFDQILSKPGNHQRCSLCSCELNKSMNSLNFWRLHVINDHFQEIGKMLGPIQNQTETSLVSPRKKDKQGSNLNLKRASVNSLDGSSSAKKKKKMTKTFSEVIEGNKGIPDYIQNIGNSVDKNGTRTDFFYCTLCKKTIDGIQKIETHRHVEPTTTFVSTPNGKEGNIFECKHCPMKFVSGRGLRIHSVDNHLLQILCPYRRESSRLPPEAFPYIVEKNFANLLESGTSQKLNKYKCNFCSWTAPIESSESLKRWRHHLVVDHFEDFINKLVELQKDQEYEMEVTRRRSSGSGEVVDLASSSFAVAGPSAPILIPSQSASVPIVLSYLVPPQVVQHHHQGLHSDSRVFQRSRNPSPVPEIAQQQSDYSCDEMLKCETANEITIDSTAEPFDPTEFLDVVVANNPVGFHDESQE